MIFKKQSNLFERAAMYVSLYPLIALKADLALHDVGMDMVLEAQRLEKISKQTIRVHRIISNIIPHVSNLDDLLIDAANASSLILLGEKDALNGI